MFCANPECQLHVTSDSPGVRGFGQWATIDGVVYDRHCMGPHGGPLYCSACRKELQEQYEREAEEDAAAATQTVEEQAEAQVEMFEVSTEAAIVGAAEDTDDRG